MKTKAVLQIFTKPRILFNLDPFKASTGKKLTKKEKTLDLLLNGLVAYPSALIMLASNLIALILIITIVVVLIQIVFNFIEANPILGFFGSITLIVGNQLYKYAKKKVVINNFIKEKKDSLGGNTFE